VGWFTKSEGPPPMTEAERQLRDRAEAAVVRGLKAAEAVREAGRALNTLKTRDLWRDTSNSWQEYVQSKFGITARRAYQLTEFANFTDAVAEATGTDVALSERALRPLSALPEEQRVEAIAEAVAESGGEPTPAAIKKAVAKRKPKARKPKAAKPITIRVAGAKVTITPTHPEPVFRGWAETLEAALAKLASDQREAA
jgi:hypothetical protein